MTNEDRIIIFDTTLRDGEQSPGASLNITEKIEIARQLERLGVDVIEAGFPISSPGDFEAVKQVALNIHKPIIAGLCRTKLADIDRCWEALKDAQKARIHTFIATSDVHVEKKLRKSKEEIIAMAVKAVKHARGYLDDVEFSAEDAARTDKDYMCDVVQAVIEAGATTVNIPDTVGYSNPWQFGELIAYLFDKVPNIKEAVISVHCHNDLGLAVANSLAAVRQGARQVECTINGLGERAGNCSLEEVIMNLHTRRDFYNFDTNINTREIFRTSRLVSNLTGIIVQRNKAIVGANAFAHEAGIHQHGMLSERTTYEIMTPESVGWKGTSMVLGKHSGRHAFRNRLQELGYDLSEELLEAAFEKFKILADKKKEIFDEDLETIAEEVEDKTASDLIETYKLEYINTNSGSLTIPTATVRLRRGDEIMQGAACGDGPVDAAFTAIRQLVNIPLRLTSYVVQAVSEGTDAQGNVSVSLKADDIVAVGRGTHTDIIVASSLAYVNAINKLLFRQKLNETHK